MCPKGDDPLTPFTDYRSITITVAQYSRAPTSGSYKFSFFGQPLSLPTYQWSEKECEVAFQQLPNVGVVKCVVTKNGRYGGYSILLQFLSYPVVPYENNVYENDGNPPITGFYCDSSGVITSGAVSCKVADVAFHTLPGKPVSFFLPS